MLVIGSRFNSAAFFDGQKGKMSTQQGQSSIINNKVINICSGFTNKGLLFAGVVVCITKKCACVVDRQPQKVFLAKVV